MLFAFRHPQLHGNELGGRLEWSATSSFSSENSSLSYNSPPNSPIEENLSLQDQGSSPFNFPDPSLLPRPIFFHILSLAYLVHHESQIGSPNSWGGASSSENDRSFRRNASLVSRRWNQILNSDEAICKLWKRVLIYDNCIPTNFDPERFSRYWAPRAPFIEEIDVDVAHTDTERIRPLYVSLTDLISSSSNLCNLRLSGALPVGQMMSAIDLHHHQFLSKIYFSVGAQDSLWELEKAVDCLQDLPSLEKLEIRFSNDAEGVSGGVLPALVHLSSLRHLALQWPLRSALPPTGDLPDFSSLSQLTTLSIKRVPCQEACPAWLGPLAASLHHLYWDPFLPIDLTGIVPMQHFECMRNLKTLYIAEMQAPLWVPTSLTALEKLTLIGRGPESPLMSFSSNGSGTSTGIGSDTDPSVQSTSSMGADEEGGCRPFSPWAWLSALPNLRSLRLQGGNMTTLPEEIQSMRGLTRLELMCNELTADGLVPGPWASSLQHLHLGCNRIHLFPGSIIHCAPALRSLHLANQKRALRPSSASSLSFSFSSSSLALASPTSPSCGMGSGCGSGDRSNGFYSSSCGGSGSIHARSAKTNKMKLNRDDVEALLTAAPCLKVLVMGMTQPVVVLDPVLCGTAGTGAPPLDFDWLARVLKRRPQYRPVVLTSNELKYELEPMDVFRVDALTPQELHLCE